MPFLNHFREMFLGEKPWDVQVKLTVCSGVALTVGLDTMGGEGLATKETFINEEHDCDYHHYENLVTMLRNCKYIIFKFMVAVKFKCTGSIFFRERNVRCFTKLKKHRPLFNSECIYMQNCPFRNL